MLATNRMPTGIRVNTVQLLGMLKALFVNHINSSHQQQSKTTPTQG